MRYLSVLVEEWEIKRSTYERHLRAVSLYFFFLLFCSFTLQFKSHKYVWNVYILYLQYCKKKRSQLPLLQIWLWMVQRVWSEKEKSVVSTDYSHGILIFICSEKYFFWCMCILFVLYLFCFLFNIQYATKVLCLYVKWFEQRVVVFLFKSIIRCEPCN